MRSLQDYISKFNTIARNLGYTGDSVEVLVQLLANASYISEIENATYMQEASLEKAMLLNSKIQHCMDSMYSVFRGTCPRIVLKIKPTRYTTISPFDRIITSSHFSIYYLGYYKLDENASTVDSESEYIPDWENATNLDNVETYYTKVKQVQSTKIKYKQQVDENGELVYDDSGQPIYEQEVDPETGEVIVDDYGNPTYIIETDDEGNPVYELVYDTDGNPVMEDVVDDDGNPVYEDIERSDINGDFIYAPLTLAPALSDTETYIIIGLIAPETVYLDNSNNGEREATSNNTYYMDCSEDNLSNDVFAMIDDERVEVTRTFANHILEPTKYIFDLTIPNFGSRLFIANYFKDNGTDRSNSEGITANSKIFAQYFKYSELDTYNNSELKRVTYTGNQLIEFNSNWLSRKGYTQTNTGLVYIKEVERNGLNTIHYKANRDRFVNSIFRSNTDLGTVLEETFPEKVISGGTNPVFTVTTTDQTTFVLTIYYIPTSDSNKLTTTDIQNFQANKSAYYVVNNVNVSPGTKYTAKFNISVEVYKAEDVGEEISEILEKYENKFGILFDDDLISEIESTISKISNVKRIVSLSVDYLSEGSSYVDESDIDPDSSYYEISPVINAILQTNG